MEKQILADIFAFTSWMLSLPSTATLMVHSGGASFNVIVWPNMTLALTSIVSLIATILEDPLIKNYQILSERESDFSRYAGVTRVNHPFSVSQTLFDTSVGSSMATFCIVVGNTCPRQACEANSVALAVVLQCCSQLAVLPLAA